MHLSVKQESDLVFRCFVFDKNCSPFYDVPTFTSQMAKEINDRHITKLKGIITATPYSSTTWNLTINTEEKEKVKMYVTDNFDTTNKDFANLKLTYNLLVGNSEVCEYLGYSVVANVGESIENPGEYEIISAEKDYLTNKEVLFSLDQFDSLANNKLEYYKNDTDRNTTKLTLDSNVKVVYNNVGGYKLTDVFGFIIRKDMVNGGFIKLIDNDSEAGYDVIFVEVGTPAVVDEVTGTKVNFKESALIATGGSISSLNVDKNATDEKIIILKDGKEISVTELKEWDVLNIIAEDKNANYIVAEVITNTVKGSVSMTTSSDTSETGIAYKIEGTTYDVAANAYGTNGLDVGDAGIFYVDKYGKIAAFNEDSSVAGNAGNYAYVLKVSCDKDDFDEYTTQLKLVTANGVATYELADKTTVYYADTTKATVSTDEQTSGTALANKCKNNLIKYTANSSGEITSITFADYNTDKFETVRSQTNAEFDLELMRIGSQSIDKDATIFLIDTSKDSDCMVGTIADLDDGASYGYSAYRDSKGEDANLIVITGYKAAADSAPAAVITSVGSSQNSEGEDVLVLNYYMNGELFEDIYTNNDVYSRLSSINEGDIVQLKISSKGVVTGLKKLVDFESRIRGYNGFGNIIINGTLSNGAYTYKSGRLTTAFGYATEYSQSSKNAVIGGNDYRLSSAKNVYVIEPALRKNKVSVGSADNYSFDSYLMEDYNMYNISVNGTTLTDENAEDIYNRYADFIFVREYDGVVKDVVIVKTYDDSYSVEINY